MLLKPRQRVRVLVNPYAPFGSGFAAGSVCTVVRAAGSSGKTFIVSLRLGQRTIRGWSVDVRRDGVDVPTLEPVT